jgi:hypothetical protein
MAQACFSLLEDDRAIKEDPDQEVAREGGRVKPVGLQRAGDQYDQADNRPARAVFV